LLGFLLSLVIPARQENTLSRVAFLTTGIHMGGFLLFVVYWLWTGAHPLNVPEIVLYRTAGYEFLVDLYFDNITAVYLLVGSLLTFIITIYSRYYLHREAGYKRFFNTILCFYLGYNVTIFAGNFETLFIGWEMLGITSFLLIAFYRDRYLPVRNAVKVFSIYRIGDVGIILAMWASHHLWHGNITFMQLNDIAAVQEHLREHSSVGIFISVMLLIAAAAKSAQFPFSSWLPRAMEGPTPSSAIFYGSLSVHFGVFLMLRTFPFWEHQTSARILTGLLGFTTSVAAFFIARVQSTPKSQIAYASISQIGIIFVEMALGLETLALSHFAGNAFLRTYQLLVSPSVVSYLIREQFYHFTPRIKTVEDSFPKRIEYSLYIWSLQEWNLDKLMNRRVFGPLKRLGHRMDFLSMKNIFFYFIPAYVVGGIFLFHEEALPPHVQPYLPVIFSFIGLLFVLKSFSERSHPRLAWTLLILSHFWLALAVSFNEHFGLNDILLYLSGVVVAGVVGYICLIALKRRESPNYHLNQYFGHVYEHPRLALVFLLAGLGLMGFPISPTFIGEDVVFSHIKEQQYILAPINALCFVIEGIAVVRLYARLFLGPHVKTYHEVPYTAS